MSDERLSRRGFMEAAGIAVGGVVLAACAPTEETPTAYPPTDFPKPTATLRPTETAPIPTETPAPIESGETIFGVFFPESLKNESEKISFNSSEGARLIASKYSGLDIAEVEIASETLDRVAEDLIDYIKNIYVNSEKIRWNGSIAFMRIPRQEYQIVNNIIIISPEAHPERWWDTSKRINFYAVSGDEIEQIVENLEIERPDIQKVFTYSRGNKVLIYTDAETGETYVFSSIDSLISQESLDTAKANNISGPTRVSRALVVAPVFDFFNIVKAVAISLGKKTNFEYGFGWVYADLGCLQESSQECKNINIVENR